MNELIVNKKLSIPQSEVDYSFVPSGGPGGQHANKAATKVILSFDVANSPALSERQRARIMRRLASRINSEGILQLSAQDTRSQHQNRDIVTGRFLTLLGEALRPVKKRRATRPSRAARERRMEEKRQLSEKKKRRRWRWKDRR